MKGHNVYVGNNNTGNVIGGVGNKVIQRTKKSSSMTYTLSHPLCKRLNEMGLNGNEYSWMNRGGIIKGHTFVLYTDEEFIPGDAYIGSGTKFLCPAYTIADLLTRENLVKVFGEEELFEIDLTPSWAHDAGDIDIEWLSHKELAKKGIDEPKMTRSKQTWEYHRDNLAEEYSTDGIEGVERYLEDYLSKKGE